MKRALLSAWILGACVPVQPMLSYGTPTAGPQAPAATGLSCMQLFTCFQGCADGACIQGCLGQADPAAQAAASAYLTCGAQCESGEENCLTNRCRSEMAACTGAEADPVVAQAAPVVEQETMLEDQPHTTANLLPWMTGQWVSSNFQFEFYGDGRVKRASGVPMYSRRTGDYACVSVVEEVGTVRQEGDLLIMDFAPARENHCGDKTTTAQGLTVRYRITWYKYSTLPTNLRLIDIDCTRGAMYCNDQMRRR